MFLRGLASTGVHYERLEQLERHELGHPALVQAQRRVPTTMTDLPGSPPRCYMFWRSGPALPVELSLQGLSCRLPGPVTGALRRPFSNSAFDVLL